mmetsp:Transcript_26179/g.37213  ORF Transcript_26179/g.37213 Transcript_26179/m.37213 type:complete len:230 (+) Transcript_26179:1427-2116(+)
MTEEVSTPSPPPVVPTAAPTSKSNSPSSTSIQPSQPVPSQLVPSVPPTLPEPSSITTPSEVTSSPPPLRRSTRSTKGKQHRYSDMVYNSIMLTLYQSESEQHLSYLATLHSDFDSGVIDVQDPCVYVTFKCKQQDPDLPSYHEAMNSDHQDEYRDAMKLEIKNLIINKTWTLVEHPPAGTNVLKGIWVFKLKRLPDLTPYKFKAHYCARRDFQIKGVETYVPVVQWSTI